MGSCEHGNASSGSMKGWEYLDQLSDYQPFKKDSVPWSLLISVILPLLLTYWKVLDKSCLIVE